MNAKRLSTHLTSVVLLLLWGGVMLYFHLSGRLAAYLPQTGIFRPMALYAGMGLIFLGIFNLATMGADDVSDAQNEEKADDPLHKEGACCGHCHATPGSSDKTAAPGRWVAMLILAVPLLVAAVFSPDRFSPAAIINKGVYNAKYDTGTQALASSRLSSSKAAAAKAAAPKEPASAPAIAPRAPSPASAATGTLSVTPSAGPRVPGSAAPATSSVVVTTLPPAATPAVAAGSTPPAGAPAPAAATPAGGKSYGTFSLEDLKSQVPMSKEGNFILEVPELYYTAGDKEVQGVITGQGVETVAQVLPEKVNNAEGKRLRVFRLLVQCCASDARPYSLPVEFADKAPSFKEMSWVKVIGKMAYRQEGGQTVPLIEATSIKETSPPENSMLY
ncbi:MAG: hypothetical protein JWO94_1316 [Verrucomicrobiaceae bacterium]|nr:hypothetical protein [Verrucomicrobiaceae bacterium]